jgi:dipeptidyl aminopeptidase/acylaminoacyl peptidase
MSIKGKKAAPFGSWKSPLTAGIVATSSNVYSEIELANDGSVYFLERRPSELGRSVVLRSTSVGQIEELTPPGFNARNRVHEYGGGSFLVTENNVFFSNFSDQLVYRVGLVSEGKPIPITFVPQVFHADFAYDSKRKRIICIREDHTVKGEAVNSIVSLDPEGKDEPVVLVSGNDFYSTARLNPDGTKLAWLTWNHPNLPFFSSEIHVGDISSEGAIINERLVAGGPEESIAEPRWSPDGILYFVSDRSDWWNIYRLNGAKVEPVYEAKAEFAGPHWVFGFSSYAFVSKGKIVCRYTKDGAAHLAILDVNSGELQEIKNPFSEVDYVEANEASVVFLAGSSISPDKLVRLDLNSRSFETIYPKQETLKIPDGYLSRPQAISFPTSNGLTAYGLYYPPANEDFAGPQGRPPPLIVISHGGPTASSHSSLDLEIQFWTSRGFGILDVNYGGSTGYGREYRKRLNGQWGIVDVDDCVSGAMFLVHENKADENKLAIRGGSAGGYTTLCALTFRKTFKAGASYYGISDLETFAGDTHKFESKYLQILVGTYPKEREVYRRRSAINYLDDISAPVIFFQGLEDKVVPPDQAEAMFQALKKKGLPTAYLPFEGEQHGFRQAKNIIRSLEAELYFYSRVFGFNPADKVEPVKIENLS